MPTVSEDWHAKKEKQDAILKRYVAGEFGFFAMKASYFALGLRGDSLSHEVRRAKLLRESKEVDTGTNWPPIVEVFVMEYGRQPQYLRFVSSDAADNAIKLLRKQPNVALATRAHAVRC